MAMTAAVVRAATVNAAAVGTSAVGSTVVRAAAMRAAAMRAAGSGGEGCGDGSGDSSGIAGGQRQRLAVPSPPVPAHGMDQAHSTMQSAAVMCARGPGHPGFRDARVGRDVSEEGVRRQCTQTYMRAACRATPSPFQTFRLGMYTTRVHCTGIPTSFRNLSISCRRPPSGLDRLDYLLQCMALQILTVNPTMHIKHLAPNSSNVQLLPRWDKRFNNASCIIASA